MALAIATLATLAALLVLLLSTAVATLVSVPLTVAFAAWDVMVLMVVRAIGRGAVSTKAQLFIWVSAAVAFGLGVFAPGAAALLLPCAGLFAVAAVASTIERRRSAE